MAFRRSEPILRRRRSSSELPSHSNISMSSAWLTVDRDWARHRANHPNKKCIFFSKTEQESLVPLPDIFAAVNSGFLDIPAETSRSRTQS